MRKEEYSHSTSFIKKYPISHKSAMKSMYGWRIVLRAVRIFSRFEG